MMVQRNSSIEMVFFIRILKCVCPEGRIIIRIKVGLIDGKQS